VEHTFFSNSSFNVTHRFVGYSISLQEPHSSKGKFKVETDSYHMISTPNVITLKTISTPNVRYVKNVTYKIMTLTYDVKCFMTFFLIMTTSISLWRCQTILQMKRTHLLYEYLYNTSYSYINVCSLTWLTF
jgi:hypothetical protein